MRTVLVACYEAWPPASGAASVTYNLARLLSGQRKLIQLVPEDDFSGEVEGFSVESVMVGRLSGPKRTLKVLSLMKDVARRTAAWGPDTVIIEGASWSVYFFLLMKRLRSGKAAGGGPVIVYHAHNVEYILRRQTRGRFVTWLTRLAEGYVVRHADLVTACSTVDAAQFERLYGRRPRLLPNGVDPGPFDAVKDGDIDRVRGLLGGAGPVVTFMGLTGYPPNREAIRFLVEDVMPLVRRGMGDARLAVVGGAIDHRENWIKVTGTLPYGDIPAVLAASDVCVAPVFSGSGTRLKILEYMAASRPVVATRKGAEGLDVENGVDAVLAETAEGTAEGILRLLRDRGLAARMGRAGRRLISSKYDWKNITAAFERDLSSVFEARAAGTSVREKGS